MSFLDKLNRVHDLPEPTAKLHGSITARTSKPKTGGRWEMLNRFVDDKAHTISPSAVAVWLVLYRNARKNRVSMSIEQIAERIRPRGRTVQRAIKELVTAGLIEVKRRGQKQVGPSTYRMIPPRHQEVGEPSK
ncbi:MAG: transcriptional regulator [Phycisphaerales bacterium]|nr:transcriptional regulator [Phycisphaerales bacterium]